MASLQLVPFMGDLLWSKLIYLNPNFRINKIGLNRTIFPKLHNFNLISHYNHNRIFKNSNDQ